MKINFDPKNHARLLAYRKEKYFLHEYALIDCDLKKPIVTARLYATKATVYCCVWIEYRETVARGGGKAGGGYHRASAALQDALQNAGVTLACEITGEERMREALESIGAHLGARNTYLHHAHG